MALGDRLREVPVSGHCGSQAMASIGALIREHELMLALISDVRAARLAGDVPAQAGLARQIAAVLAPHAIVEEHGLFPALAPDFPDQIALLQAEHRKIEASLAGAVRVAVSGTAAADPCWPDRLTRALALLRAHIFKEQDGIFPAALATLRAADWDAIDAIRVAVVPPAVPAVPARASLAVREPVAQPVSGQPTLPLVPAPARPVGSGNAAAEIRTLAPVT